MEEGNERPWGRYDILETGEVHQVKRITVKPFSRNSYQAHARRSEVWIIVSGSATVTRDGVVTQALTGEAVSIPQGVKHRFANDADHPLVLIEVQTGTYFGEDDNVRYEDDYGRVS